MYHCHNQSHSKHHAPVARFASYSTYDLLLRSQTHAFAIVVTFPFASVDVDNIAAAALESFIASSAFRHVIDVEDF